MVQLGRKYCTTFSLNSIKPTKQFWLLKMCLTDMYSKRKVVPLHAIEVPGEKEGTAATS
jgi:hypothetical protein